LTPVPRIPIDVEVSRIGAPATGRRRADMGDRRAQAALSVPSASSTGTYGTPTASATGA
jgi:hypothetical protein